LDMTESRQLRSTDCKGIVQICHCIAGTKLISPSYLKAAASAAELRILIYRLPPLPPTSRT
jgi:hypothetical protein